jgi:hypothetical protein
VFLQFVPGAKTTQIFRKESVGQNPCRGAECLHSFSAFPKRYVEKASGRADQQKIRKYQ